MLTARPLALALALPVLGSGCGGDQRVEAGSFALTFAKDGSIDIAHGSRPFRLGGLRLMSGAVDATAEMRFGMFDVEEASRDEDLSSGFARIRSRVNPIVTTVAGPDGGDLGALSVTSLDERTLLLEWSPGVPGSTLNGFEADCEGGDHFLGLGSHAFDVDHVGEAFALWTSEPGIGKVPTEEPPADWFFTGTRHASSAPMPFLLRPEQSAGILLDTPGRVDVDLCASDPDRFSAAAWKEGPLRLVLVAGEDPIDTVEGLSAWTGRAPLPPPWAFAPWNDAIRGPERVLEVARELREAGAPSSVIWSEDWKGADDRPQGYHLTGEWDVDETKYPDAAGLAADLEADGFKWFAYFSPFVETGTRAWDDAVAGDALIKNAAGEPYIFIGATLTDTSMIDLSGGAGRQFALDRMNAALDLGFDGWMADYAEWLPTDARLANGESAWEAHNQWPVWWQEVNVAAMEGRDATFFARSSWVGTSALVPVFWVGDQRTSFDADDGLPTVLPLCLGLAASGVPVCTHDVAGYQSIGNPPSDKDLWFRWASLGAFSPVMRTHHGAFDQDNWQFDTDAETLAHWAAMAREHTRLFPYRYGLAAAASAEGTPMVRPVAFAFPGEDWGRMDAWMLGDALLVAPVMEAGATGREVALPEGAWFDWWTLQPASSGFIPSPSTHIPVFAASNTTIPMFKDVPETLTTGSDRLDLGDVDGARVVLLFGGGGPFTEADGTAYTPSGAPTGSGEVTQRVTSGAITVAGVTLDIRGSMEREYTVRVVNP